MIYEHRVAKMQSILEQDWLLKGLLYFPEQEANSWNVLGKRFFFRAYSITLKDNCCFLLVTEPFGGASLPLEYTGSSENTQTPTQGGLVPLGTIFCFCHLTLRSCFFL